jgi:hypothetical protein
MNHLLEQGNVQHGILEFMTPPIYGGWYNRIVQERDYVKFSIHIRDIIRLLTTCRVATSSKSDVLETIFKKHQIGYYSTPLYNSIVYKVSDIQHTIDIIKRRLDDRWAGVPEYIEFLFNDEALIIPANPYGKDLIAPATFIC